MQARPRSHGADGPRRDCRLRPRRRSAAPRANAGGRRLAQSTATRCGPKHVLKIAAARPPCHAGLARQLVDGRPMAKTLLFGPTPRQNPVANRAARRVFGHEGSECRRGCRRRCAPRRCERRRSSRKPSRRYRRTSSATYSQATILAIAAGRRRAACLLRRSTTFKGPSTCRAMRTMSASSLRPKPPPMQMIVDGDLVDRKPCGFCCGRLDAHMTWVPVHISQAPGPSDEL